MRALTFDPLSDQWKLRDLPVPDIGDHDVLVRVQYCGLNPVDAKIRFWKRAAPDMTDEWVGGLDIVGEIVKLGSAVHQWRLGDRVVTHGNMFRSHGGFAEYSVQAAHTVFACPSLSPEIVAAVPCAGWTAWRALYDKLRITADDTLLIAGGAGGVGSFAIQLAKRTGLKTIIATTSAKNRDYVAALGATQIIDYQTTDVVSAVLEITGGQGVSRGLDCVGGENAKFVANSLRFEGEMVELVDVADPSQYDDAFSKALSFHQVSLGSGHHYDGGKTLIRTASAFLKVLEEGGITVDRLQIIPLEEAGNALQAMLQKHTVGKIVIQI